MFFVQTITVVVTIVLYYSKGLEVAKEVDGGVQLLTTGPVELIVPETLSFTFLEDSYVGVFKICYASTPSVYLRKLYANVGFSCPPDYCTLMLTGSGSEFALNREIHGDRIQAKFFDGSNRLCPRHVVNGHHKFIVIELPNCPVIVDGASLPKDKEEEPTNNASMTWIIVIVVVVSILLLMAVITGICICMRFKKKPSQAVPSVKLGERHGTLRTPPVSHRKTSPMNNSAKRLPDTVNAPSILSNTE